MDATGASRVAYRQGRQTTRTPLSEWIGDLEMACGAHTCFTPEAFLERWGKDRGGGVGHGLDQNV